MGREGEEKGKGRGREKEGEGGGGKAPPPDIASGGYGRRAAFELWRLDAATPVARPERPSAKCMPFAPGRIVRS